MMSDFAPEVAKYPQKYPASATISGVCKLTVSLC